MKTCILYGIIYKDEFIFSLSRHHFAQSSDLKCFVDGGQNNEYVRFGGTGFVGSWCLVKKHSFEELLTKYDTGKLIKPLKLKNVEILGDNQLSPELKERHENQRFVWKTYDSKDNLKYKNLSDLSLDHLKNILKTESNHISKSYIKRIKEIINQSEKNI